MKVLSPFIVLDLVLFLKERYLFLLIHLFLIRFFELFDEVIHLRLSLDQVVEAILVIFFDVFQPFFRLESLFETFLLLLVHNFILLFQVIFSMLLAWLEAPVNLEGGFEILMLFYLVIIFLRFPNFDIVIFGHAL